MSVSASGNEAVTARFKLRGAAAEQQEETREKDLHALGRRHRRLCSGCDRRPRSTAPAELFFKDPDIVEAVLSPSGRQLALTSARGAKRIGLAVFDLGTGKAVRTAQFTDGDVSDVRWVNDQRLVFGVVDLSEGSGRPNGLAGLFAVNADGSQMRQLVRRQGRPVVTDGSNRNDRLLDWNHQLLRVPAPRADEVSDEVLLAELSLDERRIQTPLWLNTRSGRTRHVESKAPPHTVGWLTDSRGELRVAMTEHEGRRAAYAIDSYLKGDNAPGAVASTFTLTGNLEY